MAEENKRGKWSENNMKEAIKRVIENHMSVQEAALQFSVPKSTLGDRIKNIRSGKLINMNPQMGRFTKTFSEELE